MLTGAGSLNGSIERQDVGLESDAVDDCRDLRDLVRRLADVAHGLHHFGHGLAAGCCLHSCRSGQCFAARGCRQGLMQGRRDLLHRSGGLLQKGSGQFGSAGEVKITSCNLRGALGHTMAGALNFRHQGVQRRLHSAQCGQQAAAFIAIMSVDGVTQVQRRHPVSGIHRLMDGPGDGPHKPRRQQAAQQQGTTAKENQTPLR